MAFSDKFLDELSERNDIVDVVGQYVRFTKKSGANMFGLCPFHSEKTPSFSVSPDKQIYHCFGCGKGGGVISFIMEAENLSFPDAVAFLAKRANMPLPEETEKEGVFSLWNGQRPKRFAPVFLVKRTYCPTTSTMSLRSTSSFMKFSGNAKEVTSGSQLGVRSLKVRS